MKILVALFAGVLISDTVLGAVTTHFALDTRQKQSVSPEMTLMVEYSPDFVDTEREKSVRVLVNDEVWVEDSASGMKLFAFGTYGFYRFAHQVLINGVVVHELLAYYSVGDGEWLLEYPDRTAVSTVIPEGIVGIWQWVFADMGNLEGVQLPSTLLYIGTSAFENDYYLDNVVIPDSVEVIGARAFKNCTEMISLKFGSGLKSVGDSAFENCISLERVAFKEGLVSLGARAFASDGGSMRLKSVVLPASLTHIGDGAFDGCDYITGVTVPTHLKTMAELFPGSYEKIEAVVIPEGVSNIVGRMFKGCKALKSIVIPNTVVTIGESAFEGCEALSEIGLPDSVVELGAAAFSDCMNLQTVGLSKNLRAINDRTFEKCPLLDSLVVPASVRTMGGKVYSGGRAYSLERKSGWYSYDYNYETRNGVYGKWYYGNLASLTGVYFLGDAPEVQSDTYEGMPSALISYVVKGSRGWYLAGSPTLPPDGWPQSGNTRPITYWTPNEFDVTFDGNGGSPATYYAKQITDTTYSLPKTNPTRAGYLFDGWWTEKTAGAQVYWNSRVTATKEHTLYAHWKLLSDGIRVIFNPNGGTVDPAEVDYPAGVTYGTLPVPTRIGHRFLGWYTSQMGGTKIIESSEVSKENNELYAHWTPITYIVRYNANGGTGSMSDQTHTYNVKQKLRPIGFYNRGNAFLGWATSVGGPVVYANEKEVENLAELQGLVVNLYAVWNVASYSVRFDANGGYGWMDNQTFPIDDSQAIAKCTLTREGYVFAGWALTWNGAVKYADEEVVKNLTTIRSSTVVLYAVWRGFYTVHFSASAGGTGTMVDMRCTCDKVYALPKNEFRHATKRFVGWRCAETGRRYDDEMLVFNLAQPRGEVTMTAIWE